MLRRSLSAARSKSFQYYNKENQDELESEGDWRMWVVPDKSVGFTIFVR
ncbi:MAG: hypothetical protein K6G94_02215 [Kiritimatiellae bacterium]|nr:hypothetical protein [Kiritimatiellia bacterium]